MDWTFIVFIIVVLFDVCGCMVASEGTLDTLLLYFVLVFYWACMLLRLL